MSDEPSPKNGLDVGELWLFVGTIALAGLATIFILTV